jgi:hypothetical protein
MIVVEPNNGCALRGASKHFGLNKNDAAAHHAERARCAWRHVKHAMLSKRTAIVDEHSNASASFRVGYANARAEWQRTVRRGKTVSMRWIKGAKS